MINKTQRDFYNTGKLLIGIAHVPRHRYTPTNDQALTQAALLDKRTLQPVSLLGRVAGAVWRWL
jgi:hypothetical protein